MEQRPLGEAGIHASKIGLGTWAIGGTMWGGTDEWTSVETIRAAVDRGITLIDTAPAYGRGVSERLVGRAVADRRDRVVLATKCGLRWDRREGEFLVAQTDGTEMWKYLHPDSVREEVDGSLQRLGTDHIDLYQTHWQEPTTRIEDTMAALLDLRDAGKIRAIGVSNASVDQIEQYRSVGPVATDQEKHSMLDRGIEQEKIPYLRERNIGLLAYSPMAMGLLTGKVSPDRTFPEGDIRGNLPRFSVDNRRRVLEMLEELRPVAEAHGITFAQLAVAWAAARPGITHVLVGARRPEQAEENVQAGEVALSGEEVDRITATVDRYAATIA